MSSPVSSFGDSLTPTGPRVELLVVLQREEPLRWACKVKVQQAGSLCSCRLDLLAFRCPILRFRVEEEKGEKIAPTHHNVFRFPSSFVCVYLFIFLLFFAFFFIHRCEIDAY